MVELVIAAVEGEACFLGFQLLFVLSISLVS